MRRLTRIVVFVVVAGAVADSPALLGQRQGGPPAGGGQGGATAGRQGGADGGRGGRGRAGGDPDNQNGRGGRGAQPVRTGTALIRGRVTNASSGSPVRRASIQATFIGEGGQRNESRNVTTDNNGGFELRSLPAGRWTLRATKSGFVEQQFGQRSVFAAADPITIAEGQQFVADFRMSRGGAFSGRVVDEFGDPIAGANVSALRLQTTAQGLRTTRTGTSVQSDDTGMYRVYGLPPGQYYVSVSDPSASRMAVVDAAANLAGVVLPDGAGNRGGDLVAAVGDRLLRFSGDNGESRTSYAPTYYPGTASLAEAQRLTLALGEDQSGINFAVVPVRAARISGRVVGSNGAALRARITLADSMGQVFNTGGGGRGGGGRGGGGSSQDGSFTLTNIPPGSYTLIVHGPNTPPAPPEVAMMPVIVNGADITGLNVVTGSGGVATGSLITENGAPLPTSKPRVTAVPAQGPAVTAEASPTGAFTLEGLVGVYTLRFESLGTGWAVKSVTANGLDVSDAALDFRPGDRVTVRVELTQRITQVTGTVKMERGLRGATVLVFADEPSKWTGNSRFVRTARVGEEGQFTVSGLPPHSRYLAIAIDYLETGEAQNPEFLQRAKVASSSNFALSAGDQRTIDLPLVIR
jgi:hypothetical protein